MNPVILSTAIHTVRGRKLCPKCGKPLERLSDINMAYYWAHPLRFGELYWNWRECDYSEPESTHKRKKANDRSH